MRRYIIDVSEGEAVRTVKVAQLDIAESIAREASREGGEAYVYSEQSRHIKACLCSYHGGVRRTHSVTDTLGKDSQGVSLTELELYYGE